MSAARPLGRRTPHAEEAGNSLKIHSGSAGAGAQTGRDWSRKRGGSGTALWSFALEAGTLALTFRCGRAQWEPEAKAGAVRFYGLIGERGAVSAGI